MKITKENIKVGDTVECLINAKSYASFLPNKFEIGAVIQVTDNFININFEKSRCQSWNWFFAETSKEYESTKSLRIISNKQLEFDFSEKTKFLLKIDKNVKGLIYLAAVSENKIDNVFEAELIDEDTLMVDLSCLSKDTRKKYTLSNSRTTNFKNTKEKKGTHSFYIFEEPKT